MSFIATAGTAPAAAITNDGFFPDIDPADVREKMRLDGTVTDARLRDSLINAIISVNKELDEWQAAQIAAGYATLADVPAKKLDVISVQIHRYLRAVYAQAKANLTERYKDFDSTNSGGKKADQMESTVDDYHRDVRWAISDIMGISRNTTELI
jgi:hypothetical protein